MPYASLTKKDETAEKKPAPGPCGVGAFCPSGGYGTVVCCPIMLIVYPPYLAVKKIIHKRREKKTARTRYSGERQSEDTAEANEKRCDIEAKDQGVRNGPIDDNGTIPGNKRDEQHLSRAHKHQLEENNPRVCGPQCPGYGERKCVTHDQAKPERPASPGLLAV